MLTIDQKRLTKSCDFKGKAARRAQKSRANKRHIYLLKLPPFLGCLKA